MWSTSPSGVRARECGSAAPSILSTPTHETAPVPPAHPIEVRTRACRVGRPSMWSARRTRRRKAVLFVTHELSSGEASLRYRSAHHAESLGYLGVSCDVTRYGAPDLLAEIAEYECIVLHRFPWDAAAPLVRRARKLGKLLVSDTDDLVFDYDVSHHIEGIEAMSDDWRGSWTSSYRRTIEACENGATTSTEPLREHVLRLASPVEALSNVVSEEMVRLAERARQAEASIQRRDGDDEVAIAYLSGSLTHRGDFEEAAQAVLWALESYPRVRFKVVGRLDLDARFDRFASRIRQIPWHPWQALPEVQAQADVNLAPLARNPFSECKSCVKYLEASLVGVPTVASARGDFTRVITHGRNGLLADDAEGWREALGQLIDDPALRRELGSRAYADVHANHTTRARVVAVEQAWRSFTGSRPGDKRPLTVDWLLSPHATEAALEAVLRLARGLAENGHVVRVCADPSWGVGENTLVQLLERQDLGSATSSVGAFNDLTPVDARIATDALTSYLLTYQETALFRFRLVQERGEVGFEFPVRHVCLGTAVARRFSERTRREAVCIEPDAEPGAALDRFLRAACFLRLRGN